MNADENRPELEPAAETEVEETSLLRKTFLQSNLSSPSDSDSGDFQKPKTWNSDRAVTNLVPTLPSLHVDIVEEGVVLDKTMSSIEVHSQEEALSHWHIHVSNEIKTGVTLLVHCKSRDDDLGPQYLKLGDDFHWDFRVNYWDTTLFWCYLRRPTLDVSFEVFWVEKSSSWLEDRCYGAICHWIAKYDGVYLKDNRYGTDELIHQWKFIGKEEKLQG